MNKYYYRALNHSIVAAAFIVMAGQFHMEGDTKMAWVFAAASALQIWGNIRNERKGDAAELRGN